MVFLRKSDVCEINRKSFMWKLFVTEFIDENTKEISTILCFSFNKITNDSLLRINSPCVTSEVFHDDNRCDCREQLEKSITKIQKHGSGFILYNMYEEGRGNGIFNKVNSYNAMNLFDMTTKTSFEFLGLPVDKRDYSYLKYFTDLFNLSTVTLLTNNQKKIAAVEKVGLECKREPIVIRKPVLAKYLKSKAEEFGHNIILDF